ncbi:hypothetical protein TNCV_5078761 [Trichonephila clavipes]|nr:hypothetical protein TNCV_5078761 [Trichonephila clavipes]
MQLRASARWRPMRVGGLRRETGEGKRKQKEETTSCRRQIFHKSRFRKGVGDTNRLDCQGLPDQSDRKKSVTKKRLTSPKEGRQRVGFTWRILKWPQSDG